MDDDGGRGRLFDSVALDYATGRPGYPVAVFEFLVDRCGLSPGARVLEIGPGGGQATWPMLELGARVTVVEPGATFSEVLSARGVGQPLVVLNSKFEDAEVAEAVFDLVTSASAFHWVDPGVGPRRCARALRSGGWLALWWNVFADPDRPDPFRDALDEVLGIVAPQLVIEGDAALSYAHDVTARVAEINATQGFGPVEQMIWRWEGRHDAAELRRMFATFSPFLALEADHRELALGAVEELARDRFDDPVVRPYQTVMYVAQRL